ncbi:MAG: aminodeoxychorismate lyase [Piscirickettsiaceae bacterium]|nr:MAG: aminodeoxychorismate lyase [Piscirickettsiaceae bacterium]PCI68850.1 MAG: aminodeoxychorismate lyase [Piscirickettsiaceae bacterium]
MSYQQSVNSSYISDETGAVVITINKGDALNKVVEKLSAKGAVEAKWFKWLVRLEGQANKIQAGEYEFSPGLTPVQILQFLVKGKVNQYAVSLIEGQTFKQILNDLHEHPAIENTLPIKADMATYLTLLNFSEKHLEGLLLPETYFFIKGTSDVEIITRAYRSMQAFINTAWLERQQNKDIKTVYDALILASIVEKETAVASERKRIAGLFLRRLEIGMKLQTDPTVIYGMGDIYQGDIRFRDLRKDTPYNTYTRYGLPPTPIAMPGKASIDAVLHPEKTRSLYFVSKGNGTHVFSETLRQHNNAVNKYQRKNKK